MSADAAAGLASATQGWIDNATSAVYDVFDGSLLEAALHGLAQLLNCEVGELALTGNTTDGLNIAAQMLNTDCIALEDEFASGPIAWMHGGHTVHFVTASDVRECDGDVLTAVEVKMAEHPTAKAVLLSSVSWMVGNTYDLGRAGHICAENGADLVVDAAQSLGAEPIDLSHANVAFLCAPSYKWLCAGPGLGVLYASAQVLKRLGRGSAPFAGWFSQLRKGEADRNNELHPHDDARQFSPGTPNMSVLGALVASLRLIEELGGVDVIQQRLGELSDRLRSALVDQGFVLMGSFGEPLDYSNAEDCSRMSAHITGVSTGFAGAEPGAIRDALAAKGIVVTAKDRHGVRGLRVSPHVWTMESEIDAFVGTLAGIRAATPPQPRL